VKDARAARTGLSRARCSPFASALVRGRYLRDLEPLHGPARAAGRRAARPAQGARADGDRRQAQARAARVGRGAKLFGGAPCDTKPTLTNSTVGHRSLIH
jgi:hypothetical protein